MPRRPRPWHCEECGQELPDDRQVPYCAPHWSARYQRLETPIRQMTKEQLAAYKKSKRPAAKVRRYDRRYIQRHAPNGGKCQDCGARLLSIAKRCSACWHAFQRSEAQLRGLDPARREAKLRYYREYMRRWRAMPPHERADRKRLSLLKALRKRPLKPRLCNTNLCELYGTRHHHCDCGLPLALTQHACALCLAEQARIEFKVWPKGEAA